MYLNLHNNIKNLNKKKIKREQQAHKIDKNLMYKRSLNIIGLYIKILSFHKKKN